jgi:hypothetical protein
VFAFPTLARYTHLFQFNGWGFRGSALKLAPVDYLILAIYFGFVLGIGWRLRKSVESSRDFLTAGRSVPVWITSLAFLAANLGAQEVIGMSASGAKYGIMTAHFYWIGAVPAMLFVGVFMMPFYYGSRARSVPEYLKLRFDEKTRPECTHICRHDRILFRHFYVRAGSAAATGTRLEFHRLGAAFSGDRLDLHVPGRPDQRDLQRSAPVLPDRAGIRAAGHHVGG